MNKDIVYGVLNFQMRFISLKKLKEHLADEDSLYAKFMRKIDLGIFGMDGPDIYIIDWNEKKIYPADSLEDETFEEKFGDEEFINVGHFDYLDGVMEHTFAEIGWDEFIEGIESPEDMFEDLKKVLEPPTSTRGIFTYYDKREQLSFDAQLIFGFEFYGDEGEYELHYKGELNDLIK